MCKKPCLKIVHNAQHTRGGQLILDRKCNFVSGRPADKALHLSYDANQRKQTRRHMVKIDKALTKNLRLGEERRFIVNTAVEKFAAC
ncbi:MAG: hypothetical protein Q4C72_01150 [Eubacteriales bacterium]|nr:hypothetical protein [Eubacteriales bacterium]